MLERSLLTMNDITAVIRIEVAGVAEDLKEAAYALLCFLLCLLLHVNGLMDGVEVSEHFVDQLEQL